MAFEFFNQTKNYGYTSVISLFNYVACVTGSIVGAREINSLSPFSSWLRRSVVGSAAKILFRVH